MGLGIVMIFLFPTDPETTKMLTEEERQLAIARMYADQPEVRNIYKHCLDNFIEAMFVDQGNERGD